MLSALSLPEPRPHSWRKSPGAPLLSRTPSIETLGSQPLTVAPLAPVPPFVISGGPLAIPPGVSRPLTIDLPPVPGCHLVTLELATNDPARPIVPRSEEHTPELQSP